MSPTYKCKLGGDTENIPHPHLCNCDASCEAHIHNDGETLCLHDGETDHNHCPNK